MGIFKLCIIYNTAPRYREAIFRAIDAEWDCDWYFGHTTTDIKEMDTSLLRKVSYYKTYRCGQKFYWQRGILGLLFRRHYRSFFMLAESRCLTAYLFFFFAHYFFPKKKVQVWTHGWYGKETSMEARLKLWMFRHVDGIFVYGHHAKQLLVEHGIAEDKLYVIHNSLDYDRQLALRHKIKPGNIYREHFRNDWPVLLFIGRLTEVKRLDLLIEAVARLSDRGEHYNVALVGDGLMRVNLEKLVQDRGLSERVWFYGACYDEQRNAELIYNADLCVAPGNVGLTAMHTMVFGCPVITHNDFKWQMPEFEAIHPGITGDFFERGSVESLADGISRWQRKHGELRDVVRQACYNEIDTQWTPYFQMDVIKNHLQFAEQ